MTSKERKQRRFSRRQEKRKQALLNSSSGKLFQDVFSFNNLCESCRKTCNGSRWKSSTIMFEAFMLKNAAEIYANDIYAIKRKFDGFHSFEVIEHGKKRQIDALPIKDRAVQKCLCNNMLTEAYSRSFIMDNSASLKRRGMDFALNRLRKHLRDHFTRYGTTGGILQFDFKNFFGSIPHEFLKERARRVIVDDDIYKLVESYIDDFMKLRKADPEGKIHKGVGLGSEVSQIMALDAASPIDHFATEVFQIKGYARYMDDGYAISDDLNKLRLLQEAIEKVASSLGLTLNKKKTKITPFKNHTFRFLKMKITLTDTGKVVMKLSKKAKKGMHRKLIIFRKWHDEQKMSFEDIICSYYSWRAHAKRCNSHKTLREMDVYFVNLFHEDLSKRKLLFKSSLLPMKKITWLWQGTVYKISKHGEPIEGNFEHIPYL